MSTNKTPNYALHAWEPEDDFLRAEFNENFEKLDETVKDKEPAVVVGTYMGDNAEYQDIILGFRPKFVILVSNTGGLGSGGICSEFNNEKKDRGYTLTDDGFRAYFSSSIVTKRGNFVNDSPYTYIAFRW